MESDVFVGKFLGTKHSLSLFRGPGKCNGGQRRARTTVAGDHDTIQVDGRMAAGLALGEREGEASLCPVAPPPLLSLFLDSSRLKNIKNLSRAAASTLCLLTFFF